PKARTSGLPVARCLAPVQRREETREVVRRDARPGVLDREDERSVAPAQAHVYLPALRRVAQRVVQQVLNGTREQGPVAQQRGVLCRRVLAKRQSNGFGRGPWFLARKRLTQQFRQLQRCTLRGLLQVFQARVGKQIGDESL